VPALTGEWGEPAHERALVAGWPLSARVLWNDVESIEAKDSHTDALGFYDPS
jgi:hypothetical protein